MGDDVLHVNAVLIELNEGNDSQMIACNINYPPLPRDQIKGVLQPEISAGHIIDLAYDRCDETGHVVPRFQAGVNPAEPHKEDGDVRAHIEGYITISAVKPRWNPPAVRADELRQRLNGIELDF